MSARNAVRACAVIVCASGTALSQDVPSASVCVTALPVVERRPFAAEGAAWDAVYLAGERCVPIWADSLRSAAPGRVTAAREALRLIGGRHAVDALRAEYDRAPTREVQSALIDAIGSTGAPDDIAFLLMQLKGPLTGFPNTWPIVQRAVNTLGLLRATSARDSIKSVLDRSSPSTFTGRAAATALAALDQPVCADSGGTDIEAAVIALALRCAPEGMARTVRYRDAATHGIWEFDRGAWRLVRGSDTNSVSPAVTIKVRIAPDTLHAEVSLSTWCGSLCGEGWLYRFIRTRAVWRLVSARMVWVS